MPAGNVPSKTYHWPLLLTPHIEEGDEIYKSLCDGTVTCVLLSKLWGLIVRKNDGVLERIGLIDLEWPDSGGHTFREKRLHLRNHFPRSVCDIVLG